MDLLTAFLAVVVVILSVIFLWVAYNSRNFGIFKKIGIPSLSPWPGVGSFLEVSKRGFIEFHKHYYQKFENEKVYGYFEPALALMVIRDLDMIRDIQVKNFNSFVNRRIVTKEKPFDKVMTVLEDDDWRHVRNTVTPTFSTGKLRRMCQHVEDSAKSLVSNLQESSRTEEAIELKDVLGCYSMDVIAGTGFGVKIDSLKDRSSPFVTAAKNMMNVNTSTLTFAFLFPGLLKALNKIGVGIFPKASLEFFTNFVDAAKQSRMGSADRHDFLQMVVDEERKAKQEAAPNHSNGDKLQEEKPQRKGLTHDEVQGTALIFMLAGYDTVATTMSFTLFSLAMHPEALAKLQEEVDTVLKGEFPTYEAVQAMPYLEMCLFETMRIYPAGFITDRVCREDCLVQGIPIPKGMVVMFPVIAIHNDPQLYPEPEKYDPERFTPENKASRHPFAYLPFGQGPRNCVGMRLALMEMKVALAAILQELTPVPCDKTVSPPKLGKFQMKAEDGLWVKMESRKDKKK